MSLFSQFGTDSDLETKGVEFTYTDGDNNQVFQVRLARAGGANTNYDLVLEREMAVYRKARDLSSKTRQLVARRTFAEACALPGTWKCMERPGLKCEGNTCIAIRDEDGRPTGELRWEPETPKRRQADGWVKGIENKAGEVVVDTVSSVAQLMEQLPDLYIMLVNESMNHKNYQADLEDDSKN